PREVDPRRHHERAVAEIGRERERLFERLARLAEAPELARRLAEDAQRSREARLVADRARLAGRLLRGFAGGRELALPQAHVRARPLRVDLDPPLPDVRRERERAVLARFRRPPARVEDVADVVQRRGDARRVADPLAPRDRLARDLDRLVVRAAIVEDLREGAERARDSPFDFGGGGMAFPPPFLPRD